MPEENEGKTAGAVDLSSPVKRRLGEEADGLDPRSATILRSRYRLGPVPFMTRPALGETLGISASRVADIEAAAVGRWRHMPAPTAVRQRLCDLSTEVVFPRQRIAGREAYLASYVVLVLDVARLATEPWTQDLDVNALQRLCHLAGVHPDPKRVMGWLRKAERASAEARTVDTFPALEGGDSCRVSGRESLHRLGGFPGRCP